jgi:hypothetical protein
MNQYSFSISVISESLIAVLDNTPDFDAINYPEGYGGINPGRTDISALTLTLTDPDSNDIVIDLFSYEFAYTYKRVEVESDDPVFSLVDGSYDVVFSITDTEGTHTITDTLFIDYNMKCELSRLAASDYIESFQTQKAIYDRAVFAFLQGTSTLVNELVDTFFAEDDTDACC